MHESMKQILIFTVIEGKEDLRLEQEQQLCYPAVDMQIFIALEQWLTPGWYYLRR